MRASIIGPGISLIHFIVLFLLNGLWRESVEEEVRLESQIPDTVAVKHQLDQRDLAQISKSKLAHFTSCQNLPVFKPV